MLSKDRVALMRCNKPQMAILLKSDCKTSDFLLRNANLVNYISYTCKPLARNTVRGSYDKKHI